MKAPEDEAFAESRKLGRMPKAGQSFRAAPLSLRIEWILWLDLWTVHAQ